MEYTKWEIGYKCIECKKELSEYEVYYSYGVCSYCGFKHPTACTIVGKIEYSYRYKKWVDLKFPFIHKEKEIRELER
jgi:DNA-directed RNA polymerase subunit RPC12/RpoP